MIDNNPLLRQLLAEGRIDLEDSAFLGMPPPPLPEAFSWNRVEGMLLGLAIGDSLGNTTESLNPHERKALYGEVRGYLPNAYAEDQPVGLPSDDTQLAFWTLEQLLEDDGLVPEHLARRFCRQRIFGIGQAVKAFVRAYKDEGMPWDRAGSQSAGNGALMRIAPVLLPHLRRPSAGLWADAALDAMVTHNDRAAVATAVAWTALLWEALRLTAVPEPAWWLETFCTILKAVEGDSRYEPRAPGLRYAGPVWRFVREQVGAALEDDLPVVTTCNRWYSGAYLLETMPSVIYILCRWGHDPEEALVRAVNDTRDNDTIAAVVGTAVGALHGRAALPARWIEGLLGRTGEGDDGQVLALIAQARQAWF